ncbi:MAG: hypothetical protein ACP5VP_11840, partial [Candidatus Limnocylindrales bacterium]
LVSYCWRSGVSPDSGREGSEWRLRPPCRRRALRRGDFEMLGLLLGILLVLMVLALTLGAGRAYLP